MTETKKRHGDLPEGVNEFIAALSRELGVPESAVATTAILDLARDVAHTIARPAAPLSTFVLGYAAGQAAAEQAAAGQSAAEAVSALASTASAYTLATPAPSPE